MGTRWSSTTTRRASAVCAVAAFGLLLAMATSSASPGVGYVGAGSAKAPPSQLGLLSAVATVPRSSTIWTVATNGVPSFPKYFELYGKPGHLKRVKPPKLGGRYGSIDAVAAGSSKEVWLGGGRQVVGIQEVPAIWRWTGKRFVGVKLPAMEDGAVAITSISASSPTNAWAAGSTTLTPSGTDVAFHWNGKRWSAFPIPFDFTAVSTSGPDNAWGFAGDYFMHWNGKAWAADGMASTDVSIYDIATSSSKLAYAVGENTATSPYRSVILKFNGSSWSTATLGKGLGHLQLLRIAMHRTSAWAEGTGTHQIVLHSSGGAFTHETTFGTSDDILGLAAASGTRAYAVGRRENARIYAHTYIAQCSGHRCKTVGS
jgi:hypothetical protein